MSRSKKKHAIVKDHPGRWYNKTIRRRQKQEIKQIKTLADIVSYNISHPYEIVNQYDICDWKIICKKHFDKDYITKIKRK